jgi:hypothetical protein
MITSNRTRDEETKHETILHKYGIALGLYDYSGSEHKAITSSYFLISFL